MFFIGAYSTFFLLQLSFFTLWIKKDILYQFLFLPIIFLSLFQLFHSMYYEFYFIILFTILFLFKDVVIVKPLLFVIYFFIFIWFYYRCELCWYDFVVDFDFEDKIAPFDFQIFFILQLFHGVLFALITRRKD